MSDNSTTYYSCYDADRLRSSTDPTLNAIAYDAHGNTTTLGSSTMTYDLSDRHMSTTTGSSVVTYERDATDRIMSRTAGGVTLRYSYSGSGDSPDMVMTTTNSVVDKMVDLLGGVTKTTHLEANVYSDRYNYPNIHGDVMLLADGNGTKQGPTKTYDPFGNPLTALVDNLTGNFDEGWLGSKDRLTETEGGINVIEMGQRQYSPKLGRFLEVDPVEGGSANDYDYDYDYSNGDPINANDLSGTAPQKKALSKAEEKIIQDAKDGKKVNGKALKKALGKIVTNEKYAGERNKQKRNSNSQRLRAGVNVVKTGSLLAGGFAVGGLKRGGAAAASAGRAAGRAGAAVGRAAAKAGAVVVVAGLAVGTALDSAQEKVALA